MTCGERDVSLRSPAVAALPDGVHFLIRNVTARSVTFSISQPLEVEFDDERDREVLARSVGSELSTIPPGTTTVECIPMGDFRIVGRPLTTTIEIQDPNGLYVPHAAANLECDPEGTITYGFWAGHLSQVSATRADAAVRGRFRGIRRGDVLEKAGYPEQPHVLVWIIRRGTRVGLVNFGLAGGADSSAASVCLHSGIRPR